MDTTRRCAVAAFEHVVSRIGRGVAPWLGSAGSKQSRLDPCVGRALADAVPRRTNGSGFAVAPGTARHPRIVVPPLDSRAAYEKRPRLAVVQWRSMTSLFSPPSAQVQALLSPLACMERWTSKEAARDELELLAYNAIGERSQSLWWNYIYLHEEYVSRFSPEQRDMLPGFPDMDTAVKVSAPSVYNWYYFRHGLPTTPWTDLHFSDLTLCLRAGALSTQEATNACLFMQGTNILPFSAHDRDTPPLWLCATWSKTSAWVPFLNYVNECALPCAGAGVLDRHAMAPALLWQWQCTQRKDIGFLTADDAAQALDGLRMKSINDNLRTQCEDHFLSYFPEYKARAEIAFSLGGPLWVDTVESFGPSLSLDVFESGPEALHSK